MCLDLDLFCYRMPFGFYRGLSFFTYKNCTIQFLSLSLQLCKTAAKSFFDISDHLLPVIVLMKHLCAFHGRSLINDLLPDLYRTDLHSAHALFTVPAEHRLLQIFIDLFL